MEDIGVTEFKDFEDLSEYIQKISNESFAVYNIRDSRSVHKANKELKGQKYAEKFKYSHVKYCCKHYGQCKTKSTGIRPNQQSFKIGCPSFIKACVDRRKDRIIIVESNLQHNHETSPDHFKQYPEQRRLDPEQKKVKMSQDEIPFIMVTVFRDEKEILKKAVHVRSLLDLEPLMRAYCPSLRGCALERTLVYCKTFEEYLDTTDHVPQMHDRFQLRFSSAHCITSINTSVTTDPSECGVSFKTIGSSVPETEASQHLNTESEDSCHPTMTVQESNIQDGRITQRSSIKNDSVSTSSDLSAEETQNLSRIYGKGKNDENLTKYQAEINKQAYIIAMEDPLLLKNRGMLLSEARRRLHDTGYKYKRANSSRSKVFGKGSSMNTESNIKYETSRIRHERLLVIREEIQSMERQLELYMQEKEKSVKGGLYEQGAKYEELARDLKKRVRTLKSEENGIHQKMKSSLKRKQQRADKSCGNSKASRKLPTTEAPLDTCSVDKDSVAMTETTTFSVESIVSEDTSVDQEGLLCVATV